MVVRRAADGTLERYVHLGTGNYNSITARLYTDLSFFTADRQICAEVANLFNTLTGKIKDPKFAQLMVAPFCFHEKFLKLVEAEIANARAGKSASITIKINSLVEKSSIDALYRASQAGVKITLIVRGICALVPQVKELSENITVRSIVGVYLEHSRIYRFENGGDPVYYAGSGDLMTRNMFKRIECLFPINAPALKQRLDGILETFLADTQFASSLRADGSYCAVQAGKNARPVSAQAEFQARDI